MRKVDGYRSSPLQRLESLLGARDVLYRLCQPSLSPGLSRDLRGEVRALLRHWPSDEEMEELLRLAGLIDKAGGMETGNSP